MSKVSEYYNKPLGVYRMSRARLDRVSRLCKESGPSRVLDVGCGVGDLGSFLKRDGVIVVGCDISATAIEEAKKVLDEAVLIDIEEEELPWESGYFDVVVMSEVIEHLFDPIGIMEKVKRILKPGGRVIITTPNFLVFSNRVKMFFGKFEYTESGFLDYGHLHFFTRPSLLKLLEQNGFELVKEDNIYHPKVPRLLARMFPNLFTYQMVVSAEKK